MDLVRTLKAMADPVRLRVLAAIAEEELTVGEVQEVVPSVQSSASRNLAILREAGFVQNRKDGTNVYFSLRRDMPEAARQLFQSLQPRLDQLPESKQDRARLRDCKRRRLNRSQNYFESLAGDWERIRKSYFDDRIASLAIEKLLPPDLVIADVGCGTGSLTFELARFAQKVIGIDQSPEMLRQAKKIAQAKEVGNVEFRSGDALKLPLAGRSVDAAFCVMVLHFLPDPGGAIAELCRITRPGGTVVVLDLVRHDQEWMREQMAHRWLGFEQTSMQRWFRQAGVGDIGYELTGAYAGEKMARNGNQPVEIFIARGSLPINSKNRRSKRVVK